MPIRPIAIAEASPSDRKEVAALYAEAGYGAPIAPLDTVMVARSRGQLVGTVRLCGEHGVTILRGMQIRRGFQRQGIGASLLAACRRHLDQGLAFCLPYAHLTGFYAVAGFEIVAAAELPDFLAQRLASYLAQGQDVLAMGRLMKKGRDGPSL
jgi:GNAT superfamily N-acetyltransferase